LKELRGTIDAVVNVAGLVDFNPPLDEAIDANAFGAQHLVELARALGDVPVMHTSTCYVAGKRIGPIAEVDPRELPFPRPTSSDAICGTPIARSESASISSRRPSTAAKTPSARASSWRPPKPTYASGRAGVRPRARRRSAQGEAKAHRRHSHRGGRRSRDHWGWPNIYTYTKSIGEQIVARSGLPFAIARPACCETTTVFPFPGWNEGMSTSVPILFLILKGEMQIPAMDVPLDFIPTDFVCSGMVMTLAELLEGSHKPVYQYGASDVNPCTARRLGELIALYKRKHYAGRGRAIRS